MNSWVRLRNILWKEWRGLAASPGTILMVTLLPILLIGQCLLIIFLVTRFVAPESMAGSILGRALAQLVAAQPEIGLLPLVQQFQVYFYQQLPLYLLIIPMMIANMLSTFSIVEEKQTRTLEPLLATPVRTGELLLGKALSGALPAILMTWVSAGLILLGIALIGPAPLVSYLLTPSWLVSTLLLAPLITLLSFLLGVIGSSRSADPKEAQGWAMVIVFPFFGLIAVQVLGILPLTPWALLGVAAGVALLDLFFLRLSVPLFRRESILVRWR